MVVGKWVEPTNTAVHPDFTGNSGNKGILGTHNGEIFIKGIDDARWAEIQAKKK
jgi:hypothetical protein